jgi:hypothetical protein
MGASSRTLKPGIHTIRAVDPGGRNHRDLGTGLGEQPGDLLGPLVVLDRVPRRMQMRTPASLSLTWLACP